MKEEHPPTEYYDPISNTTLALKGATLHALTQAGHASSWPLPNLTEESAKVNPRQYLKFTPDSHTQISLNPTSTVLLCKSDRIQDVDLTPTYSSGQTWWEIFVPHTTLFLTVGVKEKQKNRIVSFDFSLKQSGRLAFKINLDSMNFKTWVDGVACESKPPQILQTGNWTPFVRVREMGTTIALNPFSSDPEGTICNFDLFSSASISEDTAPARAQSQLVFDSLKFIFPSTLMLSGQNCLKFVRRNTENNSFSLFDAAQIRKVEGINYYSVAFKPQEYESIQNLLKVQDFFKTIVRSVKGAYLVEKTKKEWIQWAKSINALFNGPLVAGQRQQLYICLYQLLNAKFEQLRNVLKADLKLASQNIFDREIVRSIENLSFAEVQHHQFYIDPSIVFNNAPTLTFPQTILQSNFTENYVFLHFDNNKICILSIRGLPFKIGDFILSKAIKKDIELTQYQKEADEIKSNDLTKPSIYKILKNCLKYADKVKPPEKLVKELVNKRAQFKEIEKKIEVKQESEKPKEPEIIPDKTLESTLIQMGFEAKLVRTALIQCKNTSLEAAMDLIFNKSIKIEEEKKVTPNHKWTCQVCTFINEKESSVCSVCEAAVPLLVAELVEQDKKEEEKKEQVVSNVEEDVESDKIEEPLKNLFAFETNIALSPLIMGGVFTSKIRFRLFCLNPKFYSFFYEKGDAYADLTSNSLKDFGHQLSTSSIESLAFNYYGQTELKQKHFEWIPVEDVDVAISETVKKIQYNVIEQTKEILVIRIDIVLQSKTKTVFVKLDTSKVFVEKQKSFVLYSQEGLEDRPIKAQPAVSFPTTLNFPFTRQISTVANEQIGFTADLVNSNPTRENLSQIITTQNEQSSIDSNSNFLPLYIVRSAQSTRSYPHISFVSPWKGGYDEHKLYKNGVVLGHLQNKLVQFEHVCLELANKDQKLTGFFYFANDYELKPLTIYRFDFDGTFSHRNYKVDKIRAKYLVLIVEPREEKHVELSSLVAYGSVLSESLRLNPRKLPVTLSSVDLSIQIEGQTTEKTSVAIDTFSKQSWLINPQYDFTLLDETSRNQLFQKGLPGDLTLDILLSYPPSATQLTSIHLKQLSFPNFQLVEVNSTRKQVQSTEKPQQTRSRYSIFLSEYIHTHNKRLLQSILSSEYKSIKDELRGKQLKPYLQYVASVAPQDKNNAEIFFRHFGEVLRSYKEEFHLQELILEQLESKNITASGLELLLSLGSQTASIQGDQLVAVATRSLKSLALWRETNKLPYSPYSQEQLFSPTAHKLLLNSQQGKNIQSVENSLDLISHRVILKKSRLSRKYIIDLLSVYNVRSVQLAFQKSTTRNKMLISLQWLNDEGHPVGNIDYTYGYSTWSQLTAANAKNTSKQVFNGYLNLDIHNNKIKTRYLVVEIKFSLRLFTASKAETQNVTDNEIVPFVYGLYSGQTDILCNADLIFGKDDLKFVKKIGNLGKYIASGRIADTFLYEEIDSQPSEKIDPKQLVGRLQLKENREKYVRALLQQSTPDCIDFHVTVTASALELLLSSNLEGLSVSQSFIQLLVSIWIQSQTGPLQLLGLKLLKKLVKTHSSLYKQILSLPFASQKHISYIFKKSNPLSNPEGEEFIYETSKSHQKVFLHNTLQLLSISNINKGSKVLKSIGSELISFFLANDEPDQVVDVFAKLGWIGGVNQIVTSFSRKKKFGVVKQIARYGDDNDLLGYLESYLQTNPPNESTWILLTEKASRKDLNSSADSIFNSLLRWVDEWKNEEDKESEISSIMQNILKFEHNFTITSEKTCSKFVNTFFQLENRTALVGSFVNSNFIQKEPGNKILLEFSLKELKSVLNANKLNKAYDQLVFIADMLAIANKSEQVKLGFEQQALSILSTFLDRHLQIGGRAGCRHLTEPLSLRLFIANELCQLSSSATPSLTECEELARWYILNTTADQSIEGGQTKLPTIYLSIWKLLKKGITSNKQSCSAISKIIVQILVKTLDLENNHIVVSSYQAKLQSFMKQLIEHSESSSQMHEAVADILGDNAIFAKLLLCLTHAKSFESEDNPIIAESELTSHLKTAGIEKAPNWTAYIAGSKGCIQVIDYGANSNFTSLVFQSQNAFWLSEVVIGFENTLASFGKITLPPAEIIVEGGTTLEDLHVIGKLEIVPLQPHSAHSVVVYGLNLHRNKDSRFHLGKHSETNFIRLTFKSPYSNKADHDSSQRISHINFLSIVGYRRNGPSAPPVDLTSIVEAMKLLSSPTKKPLMAALLNKSMTIDNLKTALPNMRFLMTQDKYAPAIHSFLLRACELNENVGEEVLEGCLNLKNSQLNARLAAEVVISSNEASSHRLKRFFTFLVGELASSSSELTPFVERFAQISSILQKKARLSSVTFDAINLSINDAQLQLIISQATTSRPYLKLARSLIASASPLQISGFDLDAILSTLWNSGNETKDELLGSLVVLNSKCREWFEKANRLEELFLSILSEVQSGQKIEGVTKKLHLLSLLCESSVIKQTVTRQQYDLRIFQFLMGQQAKGLLEKAGNKQFRERLVGFIAKASLGSANERIIGALLKDSLNSLVPQNSQQFIAEIFLPLLNSFSKTTLSLLPFNSGQKKFLLDSSLFGQGEPVAVVEKKEKFRLASSILSEVDKTNFYRVLKQESGHKWGTFNLITNHGQFSSPLNIKALSNAVQAGQSLLIILQSKNANIGVFYNSLKKEGESGKTLPFTKGSFAFSSIKDEFNSYPKPNSAAETLISLETQSSEDTLSEQFLSIKYKGAMIGEVHFGGFDVSTLNPSILGHSLSSENLIAAEYWSFDSSTTSSYEQVFVMGREIAGRLLSQLQSSTLFAKEYQAEKGLDLLRYEQLYQFPSSITLRELKSIIEIIHCRLTPSSLENIPLLQPGGSRLKEETRLQELSGNGEDLVVELLAQIKQGNLDTEKKKVQFLPKKGILQYFEQNEGVKTMIRVIRASIGAWKNAARKQKWLQYVTQLQKFSAFPHFFSAFLKDKDTFNLLLDLLSGLPDSDAQGRWDEMEVNASQKLLRIIEDILKLDQSNEFRNYALKNDFLSTILERLRLLTGMFQRKFEKNVVAEEQETGSPSKEHGDDDGVKKVKKKKGVGYGNDTNSNTKWMKGDNLENVRKEFKNVEIILNLVEGFLNAPRWRMPAQLVSQLLQSSLLPYTEDCLRAGTLLQISKHPEKFKSILRLLRSFCKHDSLVVLLLPLSINYQPSQSESIESLLKSLFNTSKIFLSCLSQNVNKDDQLSKELATDIIETYNIVEEMIEDHKAESQGPVGEKELQDLLALPLDKKYRELLKDLRFDYIDMKESPNKIKHHYSGNFSSNYTPNQTKMIRLAQELADISTALPHQHTNAVYVRCDKDRVDFMQALIMGSNGTPYGHGAFLFDIYFEDTYPNGPPKVNLTTTGHGKIRFNPNLYACGKVCLSLLGTWRGSASENWDSKVSTLLQVLLSIQAIIMSEQVYFNEPGFENEQGTEEGEKKNEAYSNIVRYGNVKFAMLENIKNPPKGFEAVIRRHFYLKKAQIMEECKKWIKYAEKRPANYVGLVNDHNVSWSAEFKKSKTQYKEMLEKAVKELEEELEKLPPPKTTDLAPKESVKRQKKKENKGDALATLEKVTHEEIDVSYGQIREGKELDVNDEKVRDRWSRYIGAMGIDAVNRQSKADIMVVGLGPMALETVKNLVLSGCRRLTLCDKAVVSREDLSGGFFYREEDIGKSRIDSALHKIRQLNAYVKVDTLKIEELNEQSFKGYSLVLVTDIPFKLQVDLNEACRKLGVKFISADCRSAFCRLVNDFGNFTVEDRNGQEPVEVILGNIQISQRGLVTLLEGGKHPFEDGEVILINQVEGMNHINEDGKSINGTLHTVKVVNFKSFEIGSTLHYKPYIRNGIAKNVKTPLELKYLPLSEAIHPNNQKLQIESNLQFYDFSKMSHAKIIHFCYLILQQFEQVHQRKPQPWNLKDADVFMSLFSSLWKEEITDGVKRIVHGFVLSSRGYLPPLCAFFGGLVAQEVLKGITQKFKPIHSAFYLDFSELLPKQPTEWTQASLDEIYTPLETRDEGFAQVVGRKLAQRVKQAKLFMVGAGAIGCQLLKNFAMLSLGSGNDGKIILTDPDHIENSNLNRQFLFREKHISKPKSLTAAASAILMNPHLKGHISPLLERVSDATKQIFSDRFFTSLDAVANALDNVAARRYVDRRCVDNKIALFQSGTLGPKGHVQVILPHLTESYGSQNDPVEEGEIPHCTLKMFPEETLHCVEWARDIFGKKFSLQPKALTKFLEKDYVPEAGDIKALNESLRMVTLGPHNFEDCLNYATLKFYKYFRDDILQLMYTYPLDAKTKNGQPFWRLPKRPPTAIMEMNPKNLLHATFITSLAVLLAKIYQLPYPKDFRNDEVRYTLAKQSCAFKIAQFVPSDEKAKAILQETAEKKNKNVEGEEQEKEKEESIIEQVNSKNEVELLKEIIGSVQKEFAVKAEEFEKDDDANGHIDFIYAMANLRATNYKLQLMDWMTTKLKAGRIIPALATTTSCVAGLQTLEICKYLHKTILSEMRNSYLNLAIPSLQMSEPGDVKKTKLTPNLSVTLWDRWELECDEQVTFGEIYGRLHEKYGLTPKGVLQGMSRIDVGKSQAEKQQFLKTAALQKLEREENYADIVVLFGLGQDEKLLQGVPPVRLIFTKK